MGDKILEEMLGFLGGEVERILTEKYPYDYDIELVEICKRRFPNQDDRINEIKLVVTEMIGNSEDAMERANAEYHCKVASYFSKDGIVVLVEDNGPGFDHKWYIKKAQEGYNFTKEQLLDPNRFYEIAEVKQISSNGGLGIRTLLAFATHYRYNDVGNKVYMHFAIP